MNTLDDEARYKAYCYRIAEEARKLDADIELFSAIYKSVIAEMGESVRLAQTNILNSLLAKLQDVAGNMGGGDNQRAEENAEIVLSVVKKVDKMFSLGGV